MQQQEWVTRATLFLRCRDERSHSRLVLSVLDFFLIFSVETSFSVMDFGSVQFSVTFWQVLDGDRRLLYQLFSRGECRSFGWGPKEIVGQPRQTSQLVGTRRENHNGRKLG